VALSLWGDGALLTDAATWAIVADMEFNRDNTDPLAMALRRENEGAHWQEIANIYATARWRELTGDEKDVAYVTRCECPGTSFEGGFLVSFRRGDSPSYQWVGGSDWMVIADLCGATWDRERKSLFVRLAELRLRNMRVMLDAQIARDVAKVPA